MIKVCVEGGTVKTDLIGRNNIKEATMKTIAEIIFNGERTKNKLEDELFGANVQFEDTTYDEYDTSIELLEVSNEYRLSEEAQKLLFNAGFSKVYLNHINKWETHYDFYKDSKLPIEGWRVSYPSKRGKDEKGVWVEKKVEGWPSEWFETGYAIIVEKGDHHANSA